MVHADSAPSHNSNIFSTQLIRTRQLASQRRRILSGCRLGHTSVTRLSIFRQSITTLSGSSVFSIPPESPARVLTFGPESKSLPLLSLIDTRGRIPSLSSSRSVADGGPPLESPSVRSLPSAVTISSGNQDLGQVSLNSMVNLVPVLIFGVLVRAT